MILVDVNLLVYVKAAHSPQHARAKSWFEQAVRDRTRIGLPWESLLGFVRIITSARVCSQPLSIAQAWEQVEEWLALPGVWIPGPTAEHARILGELLRAANAGGNLVPDAHLAAIAVEHGLVVCSSDADFARFPGVRWVNPLSGSVMEPSARYVARRAGKARLRAGVAQALGVTRT